MKKRLKIKNTLNRSKEQEVRGQYTVVLEDIRSQNQAIAEIVTGMNDKLDEHTNKLDEHTKRFGKIETELEFMKTELEFMKAELALIRHNQVTRDEFKFLESRVTRLERARR